MTQGSIVALVTPMFASGEIDWESLEALVEWHVSSGTVGIVPVGTTGESPTVSPQENCEIIRFVVEKTKSRMTVIAGTGANSTAEAIEFTASAKESGAGSVERAREIRQLCGEAVAIYSGDDETSCDLMLEGAQGTISVTANVAPETMAQMADAAVKGDAELARSLDATLSGLHQTLFLESNPIPVKWALSYLDRIPPGIRLPLTGLSQQHHDEVIAAMQQAGVLT